MRRMTNPWAALTAKHSSVLAIVAVVATFAAAAAGVALLRDPPPPTVEQEDAAQILLHPRIAPARVRCETCGIVETILMVEATRALPRAYVLAIRMPDGSLRHSSEPRQGHWKVGDQIQLLGGERTWNQGTPAARH